MIPDTDLPVQTLGTDRQREHWWVGPETARRVAGRTAYATDVPPLDGLLHGAVLRCGVAHARVVSLDVRGARAMPGVRAVVTAEDVPEPTALASYSGTSRCCAETGSGLKGTRWRRWPPIPRNRRGRRWRPLR